MEGSDVHPLHLSKNLGITVHACNHNTDGEKDRIVPEVCWLTGLAKSMSFRVLARLCLKT